MNYELTKPGSRGSWFCSFILFFHGGLAALTAVGTIGGIMEDVAGEGEELSAGFAFPLNLVTGTLPLGKLLILGHLLLAVLAEGGHEAPGGINGEGLPALLAGFLQRNRGLRCGRDLRLVIPEKAADLFQQFHSVLL